MNVGNHVCACQTEQVVIAFQQAWRILQQFVAKVGFSQSVLLNHRAHRTVKNQDTFLDNFIQSIHTIYSYLSILNSQFSKGLYCTIHFAAVFFLLECLSLVVSLLTLAEGNIYLGTSVLVDPYERGHDGVACLFRGAL